MTEPNDIEEMAAWYIGETPHDEDIQRRVEQLNQADEPTLLRFATAVSKAATDYRRKHGEWPTYRKRQPEEEPQP